MSPFLENLYAIFLIILYDNDNGNDNKKHTRKSSTHNNINDNDISNNDIYKDNHKSNKDNAQW